MWVAIQRTRIWLALTRLLPLMNISAHSVNKMFYFLLWEISLAHHSNSSICTSKIVQKITEYLYYKIYNDEKYSI